MRRLQVPAPLRPGRVELPAAQAHHARDVLRLGAGDEVELFDAAGRCAPGTIAEVSRRGVAVEVRGQVAEPAAAAFEWAVAAAVPKGERADWMVEKLSELGTAAFIPLAAARSVVLPEGAGKRQRWERLAGEAARQSRRAGVMRVEALTDVRALLARPADAAGAAADGQATWCLSTRSAGAVTPAEAMAAWGEPWPRKLLLLVGPEGGWTDEELAAFSAAGAMHVTLGPTVLRTETAAVAAAAIAAALVLPAVSAKAARA